MRGFQRLQIVGNLGRDPESRFTPKGTQMCEFSVAVNRRWNDEAGNPQDETMWVRVTVWGPQGDACLKYLKKGSPVMVEGRLSVDASHGGPRTYVDSKDGKARASFEMTAREVLFLGGAPVGSVTEPLAESTMPLEPGVEAEEPAIPF
jgi:single-strand DNA-binding protein